MSRLFGLVLILVAMYIGMQIYTDSSEGMLSGALGQIESSERDSSPFGGRLTGSDVATPTEQKRGSIIQRIRDEVTADLQNGAERRGY